MDSHDQAKTRHAGRPKERNTPLHISCCMFDIYVDLGKSHTQTQTHTPIMDMSND